MKLHLGCGPHVLSGWTNYDIEPGPGGIKHDLRTPLREATGSVDFVFNEHFLEHVTRDEGVRFLRECARVLKPAGVLRVSTPSLAYLARKYSEHSLIDLPGVWSPATPCRMLNEGMRLWGHQFLYDMPELFLALQEAGFTKFETRAWRSSNHAALNALEVRPFNHELILEAQK